jgi:hypothetical protein
MTIIRPDTALFAAPIPLGRTLLGFDGTFVSPTHGQKINPHPFSPRSFLFVFSPFRFAGLYREALRASYGGNGSSFLCFFVSFLHYFIPQKNIGGPQKFIGGPQEIIGGPQENVGGPQKIIGGPQEIIGGPQENVGGPQKIVGGHQKNNWKTEKNMRKYEKDSHTHKYKF